MSNGVPIIRIENLSKRFISAGNAFVALEHINLDVHQGEIFGIIGMSGAGKSTLVRCINFLEKPTTGTVFFDGRNLSALSRTELYLARQSMGMIFQQFNLLMQRNALSNVCFPLEIAGVDKKAAVSRANELLELVGLSDKKHSYPAELSGGQRQRVAIARALATNPKVLLCDEATSALDPSTTCGVLSLLKDINNRLGITIIVITHEMSVIEEICHNVAIIDNGIIAETGSVRDIFSRPQSDAAKRLVYPTGENLEQFTGGRCCRIVFDGSSSYEPVVADMVLAFRQSVNILFADTKNIEGRAYGQIVIELPEPEATADKMMDYLRSKGLTVEEVTAHV